MTDWQEFHGKRQKNYAATGPQPAPVVLKRIVYPPGERVMVTFQPQPDPRDARITELERRLDAVHDRLALLEHHGEAQP